jgi:hypothetical protein
MSELQIVHRCGNCKGMCAPRTENIMRTPSRCVLIEASQASRGVSSDELDKKLNVWAAAAPPIIAEPSPYALDMLTLDKASAITNSTIVLTEEQTFEAIQSFVVDGKAHGSDEDESVFGETFDDDDDDDDDDETSNNEESS